MTQEKRVHQGLGLRALETTTEAGNGRPAEADFSPRPASWAMRSATGAIFPVSKRGKQPKTIRQASSTIKGVLRQRCGASAMAEPIFPGAARADMFLMARSM